MKNQTGMAALIGSARVVTIIGLLSAATIFSVTSVTNVSAGSSCSGSDHDGNHSHVARAHVRTSTTPSLSGSTLYFAEQWYEQVYASGASGYYNTRLCVGMSHNH